MTDGCSAVRRDEEIRGKRREVEQLEANFFQVEKRCFVKKEALVVARAWESYANTGNGYNLSPNKLLARRRVLRLFRILEGKISYEEARKTYLEETANFEKPFGYFAVNGHGKLMNIIGDNIISLALERKFGGDRPDAFRVCVESDGRISFEKVTCANCPNARSWFECSQQGRCNCYNEQEYKSVGKQIKRDKEENDGYLKKYGVRISIR